MHVFEPKPAHSEAHTQTPTPTASTINNVSILRLRGWIGFRVVSLNYKLVEGLAETLLDLNSGISTKEF